MKTALILGEFLLTAACGPKSSGSNDAEDGGANLTEPVISKFEASATTICDPGPQSATLSWEQTGATAVTIDNEVAPNGTAWALYIAQPETLTLIRRTGSVWSVAASRVLGVAPAVIQYETNPRAEVSPDKKTAVVIWGQNNASKDAAYASIVNLETNTISAPIVVLPPTDITTTDFQTSLAFSNDGVTGKYAVGTHDGRVWTGSFSTATKTFGAPTPFHPEKIVIDFKLTYDSCSRPFIVFNARNNADPSLTTFTEHL